MLAFAGSCAIFDDYLLLLQVRKAYKKFALRMHPDKAAAACRFSSGLLPGARLVGDAPAIEVQRPVLSKPPSVISNMVSVCPTVLCHHHSHSSFSPAALHQCKHTAHPPMAL